MDFDAHFQAFLINTVNLKPWKLGQLDSRVAAITDAFQNDDVIGHLYKEHVPQGSWAHQTIIDPVGEYDEFDADILLHLEQNLEWNQNPKVYLRQVRAAFKRNSTYKSMVRRKNRCVRIEYANECHVDVVPSINLDDGRRVIIYYAGNQFEDTNPVGFADWMKERDDLTDGNLRRVIRLFKWIRDYKNTFSCPSVILTVMLGSRVRYWDANDLYADTPRALVNLLEDLSLWLNAYPTMPLLDDPSCPGVSFNHRWTEEKYANFRKKVQDYAVWAREAFDLQEVDNQAALLAWQKIFGAEFAADEVKAERSRVVAAKGIQKASAFSTGHGGMRQSDRAPQEQFIQDQVRGFELRRNAQIKAYVQSGNRMKNLRSERAVGVSRKLRFHLDTDTPEPYDVLWKVRNFGSDAARIPGGLRGQIHNGGNVSRNVQIENTAYRGIHYVEAYVVKNGIVVASDHHNVRIV